MDCVVNTSIFDLVKVGAEVARRQRISHNLGVSYFALDIEQGKFIEYLPNGNEVTLGRLNPDYS